MSSVSSPPFRAPVRPFDWCPLSLPPLPPLPLPAPAAPRTHVSSPRSSFSSSRPASFLPALFASIAASSRLPLSFFTSRAVSLRAPSSLLLTPAYLFRTARDFRAPPAGSVERDPPSSPALLPETLRVACRSSPLPPLFFSAPRRVRTSPRLDPRLRLHPRASRASSLFPHTPQLVPVPCSAFGSRRSFSPRPRSCAPRLCLRRRHRSCAPRLCVRRRPRSCALRLCLRRCPRAPPRARSGPAECNATRRFCAGPRGIRGGVMRRGGRSASVGPVASSSRALAPLASRPLRRVVEFSPLPPPLLPLSSHALRRSLSFLSQSSLRAAFSRSVRSVSCV